MLFITAKGGFSIPLHTTPSVYSGAGVVKFFGYFASGFPFTVSYFFCGHISFPHSMSVSVWRSLVHHGLSGRIQGSNYHGDF